VRTCRAFVGIRHLIDVAFVSPLSVALTDPVPPSAIVLVRRRFFIGEPLRATEAILAYPVERRAGTFHDLLEDPMTPLRCADLRGGRGSIINLGCQPQVCVDRMSFIVLSLCLIAKHEVNVLVFVGDYFR
jgi:hypothetical protein